MNTKLLKPIWRVAMLLLLCIALPFTATAYDFMVDGIAYLFYDHDGTNEYGVSVTYADEYSELTIANIPSTVNWDGETYVVTSIYDEAFNNCSKLTIVTIPKSVTHIGDLAFYNCSGLTSIVIDNRNPKYDSRNNCNAIIETATNTLITGCKNSIIPNSVTAIGNDAFYSCSGLTSINIPNSVTEIGWNSFYNCNNLASVTIGNSVTSIQGNAFNGCTSLSSITIPNSVTEINGGAFSNCGGLTSIVVESGNHNYDSRDNCNAIIAKASNTLLYGCKNTTIPNSVTSIGENAFSGCSGLTSITLHSSITSVGLNAFSDCSGLRTVNWNLISCDDTSPFQNSTGITSFIFGDEVEYIPGGLCFGLSGLTSITIPNSVTSIGIGAFYDCSGLTNVDLGNSVSKIGALAFCRCSSIPTITIPVTVDSIGAHAFAECYALKSMIWNAKHCADFGTQEMGYYPLFRRNYNGDWTPTITNLTDFTFGHEVEHIPSYLCADLNLSKIYNHINHPTDVSVGYYGLGSYSLFPQDNSTIYVTRGRVEEYKNAEPWKYFNIVEGDWMIPTNSISLLETDLSMYSGENVSLHIQTDPWDASIQEFNWQSSDPTIASVDNYGLVTALTVGTATITVTTIDGTDLSASCEVTVTGITELTLNKVLTDIYVGGTDTLTAIFSPNEVVNKNLIWQSSDTTVAVVRAENSQPNISGTWQTLTNDFDKSLPFKRIRVKPQNPEMYWVCYLFSRQPDGVPDGDFSVSTWDLGVTDNGEWFGGEVFTDLGDNWYEYEFSETLYFLEPQENVGQGYVQVLVEQTTDPTVECGPTAIIMAIGTGTAVITATTTDGTNLSASCQVNSSLEYGLVADSIEHTRGESTAVIEYPVELINKNIISGLQFEVELPEGISLVYDEDVADVWLDDARKARDHSIDVSEVGDNHYFFIISSSTNKELKDHDGTLFYMKLLVDQYHSAGIYHINFTNLTLAEANETEHTAVNTSSTVQFNYILGDADADAKVDVADYITTALYIMNRPTIRFYEDAANVHTANTAINVTDLTGITNIALGIRPTEILHAPSLDGSMPSVDMKPEMNVNVQKLDAERWMMSIDMNNYQPLAAMQFDLQLPDGVTYESACLTDRAGKLQITDGTLPNGTVRLLVSAFSADDIEAGSGEVIKITLKGNTAHNDMAIFNNITLVERNLNSHQLEPISAPIVPTAIDDVITYNEVRIYPENGYIVIESPYEGTAQLVRLNGISLPLKVLPGRNIYKVDKNEFHFVRFGNVNAKLRF